MKLTTEDWALLAACLVLLVLYVLHWRAWIRERQLAGKRVEGFLPALLGIGLGIGGLVLQKTGTDQKIAGAIVNKVGGGGGGGGGGPTYRGRQWDGYDWSCPDGTVETTGEDSKACITSQFHPKVGDKCLNGTTPATNGQCEVGYTQRVNDGGKWVCPFGTSDTGKNWDNSSWHEAQKQCKRGSPYTRRIFADNKWQCPPGTKDTGLNWSNKEHGEKQCKWQ